MTSCRCVGVALLFTLLSVATHVGVRGQEAPADALLAGFHDPPAEARPATYWLWLNGYVNRGHVERELAAMYDAGIRGVCIFDMGARGNREASPPAGPAFMSDHSVADVAHAVRVAQRLGMTVQLSVASSWDMGGAWVEPRHASMGLFHSEVTIDGPGEFDAPLPFPRIPAKAPRRDDGRPVFHREVAVLAVPAARRRAGHDFVFRLDPPGAHTLSHAVLCNTVSDDPATHGPSHLFTKDFTIAVSTGQPTDDAFREVFRGSLQPTDQPQRFDLPPVAARYVRLRLLSGHNERFDRIQLGEFELYDAGDVNLVGSHAANRSRDGADLLGRCSALGHDRVWTAANIHDGSRRGPGGSWSSAGPPPPRVDDPAAIVDLSERLDAAGRLQWSVPPGKWIVMRFVCANTGERLKVPSPNSDGLATDHLSAEATRTFLNHLIGRLESQLGDLDQTALKQLYLASYEVRGPIWTPELPRRFREYRGYDLRPFLPALSGAVIGNEEMTRRFLYDYRKTLGDLLVDAYYRAAVDVAHDAGLGIESEAGGPGPPIHQVPVDALKALGAIDEVRGEFWPKRPQADRLWVVKETACAAHIYGKRRVHMEAFTSMHHWQDGPLQLKPSADRAFCEGMNHVVWHTGSHMPPEAGRPGWAYGAGTHLNTNLVWWPHARAFLDYLARCSFLLQQGRFVGDVCYYYGDQGYNFVPPKHVDPSLGPGFDYDVINREALLRRMTVQDGRLTLPDGTSYAVLALPARDDIDLDVLKKIDQLVADGATVVGPKPTRSNGLTDYPHRDAQVRQLADGVWGPCDGEAVKEHQHGRGRVVWGRTLREVLGGRNVGPDFAFTGGQQDAELDFLHRRTGEVDIYFVRNKRPRWEQVDAEFRVAGRAVELWDPATGNVTPQHVARPTAAGTIVPLRLPPFGSTFVVMRAATDDHAAPADGRRGRQHVNALPAPRALNGPWDVRFNGGVGAPFAVEFDALTSWPEHPDRRVRVFSGLAEYRHDFVLPADWLADDRRVLLDLGAVRVTGEVRVNGQSLGIVWKPPYVVDITGAATAGRNTLVVEVANTWSNRLAGDAQLPANERLTRTNITHTGGKPWKDVPLLPSGLIGPVRLVPAVGVAVEPK